MNLARQLIEEEEGRKRQPYYDSLGFVTWGVGHLGDPRKTCPLPDHIIDVMLDWDCNVATSQAAALSGFEHLNDVQQAVIVGMVFQLGIGGVRDFKKMLSALSLGDYRKAAIEGRDSKWARQDSPKRASRAMEMLETGVWKPR